MPLLLSKQKTKKQTMKKNLIFLFVLAIAISSCQKDESTAPSNNVSTQKVISSSIRFTKKVLVEEFSGCSYGNVPNSNLMLMNIANSYVDRVYIASMHTGDAMQTQQASTLTNYYSNGSPVNIPCAMINRGASTGQRLFNYQQYQANVQQTLSQSSNCGLAINSRLVNGYVNVTVQTKFATALTGNYKVTAYLVNETVSATGSGYAQVNNFNNLVNNHFYNMGNPIQSYTHQNVVRKVLSPSFGSMVNSAALVTGGIDTKQFTCDITTGINTSNMCVIAFVTNSVTGEVLNVQRAAVGTTKMWD